MTKDFTKGNHPAFALFEDSPFNRFLALEKTGTIRCSDPWVHRTLSDARPQ